MRIGNFVEKKKTGIMGTFLSIIGTESGHRHNALSLIMWPKLCAVLAMCSSTEEATVILPDL